jgi:nucleotide-binding universal stress UspA family protein
MKKILFTTDFSANAAKAFHFALNMAEKHQAELILAHVFDIPNVWNYPIEYNPEEMKPEMIKDWKRSLKEFLAKYDTKVKAKFEAVEHPSVLKGILSIIETHQPQLLVVGTRGKSRIKDVIFGSTTKALVKHSPIPVMAIPENPNQKDFDKVLYASDLRDDDVQALSKLVQLVEPYQPEIQILHIYPDSEYKGIEKIEWFKELVKEHIAYERISFEILQSDDIFSALHNHMIRDNFDLLVMLEKKRSGIIDKLFHEDLVKKMEFHTRIPLLSYNEHFLLATNDKDIKKGDTIEH